MRIVATTYKPYRLVKIDSEMKSNKTDLNNSSISRKMACILMNWSRYGNFSKVILLLFLVLVLVTPTNSKTSYSKCLQSCVHCKNMFGKYFLGHLCARKCIKERGHFMAVCTQLDSIRAFLDLASIPSNDE